MYLDLEGKTLAELREEAKKLGIKRISGMKKDELLKNIKIAIHEINVAEAAERTKNRLPKVQINRINPKKRRKTRNSKKTINLSSLNHRKMKNPKKRIRRIRKKNSPIRHLPKAK